MIERIYAQNGRLKNNGMHLEKPSHIPDTYNTKAAGK